MCLFAKQRRGKTHRGSTPLPSPKFKERKKMLDIKAEDGTISISFTDCVDCPYMELVTGGIKKVCNYPLGMVKRPYAKDRVLLDKGIMVFCPLV